MDIDLSGVGEQIGRGLNRSIIFYEVCFIFGFGLGYILYMFILHKYIKTRNRIILAFAAIFISFTIGFAVVSISNLIIVNYSDASFSFMSFVDRK